MAEARRLKSGRWRIYRQPNLAIVRDPAKGTIPTFDTLTDARRWWSRLNPKEPSLQEAHKCARCGTYFGPRTPWTMYDTRPYHLSHVPGYKPGDSNGL
jgi:hypothetical protein